jgi:hypothetical protein
MKIRLWVRVKKPVWSEVNPSTPRPEGQGLLRVDSERRFSTPSSKARLGAAKWVKGLGFEDLRPITLPINQTGIFTFTYKAKNLFSEILEKYFDNDA